MDSYNDHIELRERVLKSKKLDKVGHGITTCDFPCLRSSQLCYWSDNEPEASERYITLTRIEFIQCYTVYARVQFMLAYLPVGCLQGHCQVVQIHSQATVTSVLSRIF